MAATPSSYSITMRLYTAPDHGVVGTVATRPTTAGSTSVCSRIVMEYDALVAARRFFSLAMLSILPGRAGYRRVGVRR